MAKLGDIFSNLATTVVGFAEDHAEELCAGAAIVASAGAVALAVKATFDIQDDLEDVEDDIDAIKDGYVEADGEHPAEYESPYADEEVVVTGQTAVEAYKADLAAANKDRIVIFVKAYWPVLALEATTIASVLLGRKVARDKQEALAAKLAIAQTSIAAIQASYEQYRRNVIDRFGKETDQDMRLGLGKEEKEVEYKDAKGKTKTKKEEVQVQDPDRIADRWVRCFDESSRNWNKEMFCNRDFLMCAENYFNQRLRTDGFICVNQVYDWLDVPQCVDGQTWGWIYDPDIVHQINFGVLDITNERKRAFVNGDERSVFIDFGLLGQEPTYIADKVWGVGNELGIANSKFIGRGTH